MWIRRANALWAVCCITSGREKTKRRLGENSYGVCGLCIVLSIVCLTWVYRYAGCMLSLCIRVCQCTRLFGE